MFATPFGRLPELVVDGAVVPAPVLSRAVSAAERELSGPGTLAVAPREPGVAQVATVIAAWRLGRPLLMGSPAGGAGPRLDPVPDGVAVVFWTSGSTGQPRAVPVDRAAIAYQVEATSERLAYGADDALLVPLPLTHAYGFSLLAVCATLGAGLWLETGFRVSAIASRLLAGRVTTLDGVPSMYELLLEQARRSQELRRALGALRVQGCGGDVLPAPLASAYASVTGGELLDGYGLTEAGPNVALNGPGDARPGTVGRPLRGTLVRREPVSGELQVCSPSVFAGYLDGGADAGEAMTPDGWLRTGDLGSVDDAGYVRVEGRLKHALIVHGETIPPAAIEAVLAAAPGVTGSCVVGVRTGAARGDNLVAFVEVENGLPAQLWTHVRASLPPLMRPRLIEPLASLPRLAGGKLDRAALQRRAAHMVAGTARR